MLSHAEYQEVLQMRREFAALRFHWERTKAEYYALKAGFRSDQPRWPKGTGDESGRWSGGAGTGAANLGADAYQSFKFLAPEIETILPLVEAAQVAMRDYYVGAGRPATFAGALNAVSKIEYQCSRSGIRAILNKTLVQAKPQYTVVDGTLYAHQAKDTPPATPPEKPAPAGGAGK